MRFISPSLAIFCTCLIASYVGCWNSVLAQDKIKSSKTDSENLLEKAVHLMQSHHPEEALHTIDAAIAQDPRLMDLRIRRVLLLMNLNRTGEANQEISKALKIDPNDACAHATNCQLLFRLKRIPEALRESERAIALKPSEVRYRDLKISCLLVQGNIPAALEEVSAALAFAPHDAHLHREKAQALTLMGRLSEALGEISKAVELNPQAEYIAAKSHILLELKRSGEAETEIVKALKLEPNSREYRRLLVGLLSDEGKFASAKSHLIMWLPDNKGHADDEFISTCTNRLSVSGGKSEALEVISRAIAEEGAAASVQLYAARIGVYCLLGDDLNAKKDLVDCLEKSKNPVNDCELIASSIVSSRPYSISHTRAVGELRDFLGRINSSNRFDVSEHKKIGETIRNYALWQDQTLSIFCHNCGSEAEAFKLVEDIGKIKRKRAISEFLYEALARLQIRSSNLSDALAFVSDGLKTYPNSTMLLEMHADLLNALGRKKQALADMEKVQRGGRVSFTPDQLRTYSRGMVWQFSEFINDDEEAAKQALEPALKRQHEKLLLAKTTRERSADLLALAELEIADKNYADALKQTEESIKLDGGSARAYELSSWALQGLKKYAEASKARRKALTLFAGH